MAESRAPPESGPLVVPVVWPASAPPAPVVASLPRGTVVPELVGLCEFENASSPPAELELAASSGAPPQPLPPAPVVAGPALHPANAAAKSSDWTQRQEHNTALISGLMCCDTLRSVTPPRRVPPVSRRTCSDAQHFLDATAIRLLNAQGVGPFWNATDLRSISMSPSDWRRRFALASPLRLFPGELSAKTSDTGGARDRARWS